MANSLQDQLLALGLANESQRPENRKKAGPGARKGGKKRTGKPRRGGGKPGGAHAQQGKGRDSKARTSSRGGGGQQELSPEERALRQRVHKLITDTHLQRGDEAQVPFHFVKGSRVKRIYVTEEQQRGLSGDQLAVAAMKGRHYVIPMDAARQIRELIPAYYISMGSDDEQSADSLQGQGVDDEYAGYEVPDDLMW